MTGFRSGWNMPPGCFSTPFDEPEPIRLHCRCGAFLKDKPDDVESWEHKSVDEDGKEYVAWSGITEYRKCSKCKETTSNSIY